MLHNREKWLWDFWFAQHGGRHHMFYLQADRALENPDLRHWNVSIGHATSSDLVHWNEAPDAIAPERDWTPDDGPEPPDTCTTWTGSVLEHDGLFYMFYTGTRHSEKGLIQRICLATSKDLTHWQKHGAPIVEADSRWYEKFSDGTWQDESWRDPFVFHNPDDGRFHMLITARVNHGDPSGRGTIAHAVSDNLLDWEVKPPIVEAGKYAELEVPQVMHAGGRYYLLFSTSVPRYAQAHLATRKTPPVTGSHYLIGPSPLGPFVDDTENFWIGDPHGSLYSGKIVEDFDGQWSFMAFQNYDENGRFIGTISDPVPVQIAADGELVIEPAPQKVDAS